MSTRQKVTAKLLRENGWQKHAEGIGWTKNGAFYGPHVKAVGQFDHHTEALPSIQMYLDQDLPPEVVMHLINAFASARDVIESEASKARPQSVDA